MSLSDLGLTGGQKSNINHFASIVRIVYADGKVSSEEATFLKKLAQKNEISEEKFKELIGNPSAPLSPPTSYQERIEKLYELASVVIVDNVITSEEKRILTKITTGIGFPTQKVDEIVEASLELVASKSTIEVFAKMIKEINQ